MDAVRLDAPLIGGDVLALKGFTELRESLDGVAVVSSGSLPDPAFTERYKAGDPFAPDPGLLATLTYDAAAFLFSIVDAGSDRAEVRERLAAADYSGINGAIRFDGTGYWLDAPIYRYRYDGGALIPTE
jgi:hypothetical protein